jgi:hypothetical protein
MPVRDSTTRGIHSPNAKTRTGLINPRERYRRCSLPDRMIHAVREVAFVRPLTINELPLNEIWSVGCSYRLA